MELTLDLRLMPHQKPVFRSTARNVVYAKGRRAGGTEGAARALLDKLIGGETHKALWVDTVHRNINRYIKRYFMPRLRKLVLPNGKPGWHWQGQDLVLTLFNGNYIDFGSAQHPESLEGFGYDLIVLNEAGIILFNEDLYYSTLLPMGMEGPGAQWWFVGAPKGSKLFATMFAWGQDPEMPDWESFRHTSFDNPLVNADLIRRFSKHMPEKTYRQEILAEFLDDANFFANVAAAFRGEKEDEGEGGIAYCIGLDLAREEDFTVAWVGRSDQRRGVLCDRYSKMPWPAQVERIAELSARFNNAQVIADATGLGGLYAVDDLRHAGVSVEAFTFTSKSKAELMHNLAVDLEQSRLALYPHDVTRNELISIQRTFTPSGTERFEAPQGLHDDCVMALGLMVYGFGAVREVGDGVIFTAPGIGARRDAEVF